MAGSGEVDHGGNNAVVQLVESGWNGAAVPVRLVEGRKVVENPGDLGGAGWRPALRPGRAVLPQLEDRGAGVGGARGGVGRSGGCRLVGRVNEFSGVVGEPAGERVVGPVVTQFGQDLFPEPNDGVLTGW